MLEAQNTLVSINFKSDRANLLLLILQDSYLFSAGGV